MAGQGPDMLWVGNDIFEGTSHAIGGMFRVRFPSDWAPEELYEFNWDVLKHEVERFQRFDYNAALVKGASDD